MFSVVRKWCWSVFFRKIKRDMVEEVGARGTSCQSFSLDSNSDPHYWIVLERTRQFDDVVEVIRRLVTTPTKAYCLPLTMELSNRVLEKYKHVLDWFLRVTFMEEVMQNLNRKILTYYAANHQRTAIFQRVKSVPSNGFYLYGRRYFFLAFSAKPVEGYSRYVAEMRKKDMNICSPFGSSKKKNPREEKLPS